MQKKKTKNKRYYLGVAYPAIYFTEREGQCMVCILKGFRLRECNTILQISVRTIEFYVQNMKEKLGCNSIKDLVQTVQKTDFMNHIDEISAILKLNTQLLTDI